MSRARIATAIAASAIAGAVLLLSRDPQDLHAAIRASAVAAVAEMDDIAQQQGKRVKFTTTYRPQSEQDRLYAQGRTAPGPIVTWLRTGAHNTDLPDTPRGDAEAFDFGVFQDGKYLGNDPLYAKLGPICERHGLAWGGRWKSPDMPHCERINWRNLR